MYILEINCDRIRLLCAEIANMNICYLVTFRLLLNEPARTKSKLNNSEIIGRVISQLSRRIECSFEELNSGDLLLICIKCNLSLVAENDFQ